MGEPLEPRTLFSAAGLSNLDGAALSTRGAHASAQRLYPADTRPSEPTLLKDINPGPASSGPVNYITVGGESFFAARTDSSHDALYVTNGTISGTTLLHTFGLGFNLYVRGDTNGELFFAGRAACGRAMARWPGPN